MRLGSHQFFGRANDRTGKAALATGVFNEDGHLGVGDVRAVPSEQEVHPVDGGNGDVRGVGGRLGRQGQRAHEGRGEVPNFVSQVEQGEILQGQQAFARGVGIAGCGFVEDELGNENIEVFAARLPPFLGDLLVAGANQIPTGPGGKIAGHGGFQVELWFQRGKFADGWRGRQG